MTFKEVQLQDILDIQWGDTKTTKASYVSEGYLAYSATGPDGFLEKFDYDREGIVLSAIGANCGSTFFASGKWSCIKNTIRILPKGDAIDLKYFFYMTKAPDFWPIRGSAQPFISQTDIRELHVQIPEISVQKVIGEILFTLEEKIAANTALSKTLEEIAQTIFKSWFIDFDPVKAKMAGEKPAGMDASTAELFPDSMDESELGLIPKGWKITKLCDFAGVQKKTINPQNFPDYRFHHYSLPGFDTGKIPVNQFGHEIQSNKFILNDSCVLVSKLNPSNPRKWLVLAPDANSISSTEFIPLTPKRIEGLYFLNCNIRTARFQAQLVSRVTGSTGSHQRVKPDDMLNIEQILPNMILIEEFARIVSPMFHQIESLNSNSNLLQSIRDALLPRLISGELQISEEMLAS